DAIMMYLEDFVDGNKFFKLAQQVTAKKPIILLKPGTSSEAKKAISSHTGSIAQDSKIVKTALTQSGCLQVETVEELFDITKLLSWQPALRGNNIAVVTNAGGVGIQTVDDLERNGLNVTTLDKATEKELASELPKEANIHNPIDVLGDALADRYKEVLNTVMEDKNVDGILVILTPQQVTQSLLTARYVNEIADAHQKTVVTSFVGGESIEDAVALLAQEKIPQFDYPNDAARALGLTWIWAKRKSNVEKITEGQHKFPTIVNSALKGSKRNHMVDLKLAQSIFIKHDLPLLPSVVSDDLEVLEQGARNMNYPVVLKLVHPGLIHKTEFKAVRLDIKDKKELDEQYRELKKIAAKAKLNGAKYEVQPFIKDKLELIIGIKKDEDQILELKGRKYIKNKGFGHFLIFGAGGIYAEVYEDVSLRMFPLNEYEIREMISETKVSKILRGARGKSYNEKGVVEFLLKLNELIAKNNNIREVDINPLFVSENNVYIADLKLFA
ncbi:acetate--CoA ligase family protein, partial [Candidatus Dojkabacteria bacterium]|nr:acetate--CoA ligase family protein [Candidatus Dojkabacteria bacterium]